MRSFNLSIFKGDFITITKCLSYSKNVIFSIDSNRLLLPDQLRYVEYKDVGRILTNIQEQYLDFLNTKNTKYIKNVSITIMGFDLETLKRCLFYCERLISMNSESKHLIAVEILDLNAERIEHISIYIQNQFLNQMRKTKSLS